MNDIQSRLSYISSCYLLEKVRTSDYCFYIRPPVTPFKTLDFHRLVLDMELFTSIAFIFSEIFVSDFLALLKFGEVSVSIRSWVGKLQQTAATFKILFQLT